MDYLYELHCHTSPVSGCAVASAEEMLTLYKERGFDGVFITNHFLDGNINKCIRDKSYAEQIEFYFSDYEKAKEISQRIGIKVFCGVESSHRGMDVLVYGLDKDWFLAHPEIMTMDRVEQLQFFRNHGAFVTQAHPFRAARYIDRITLYVQSVDAFETFNRRNTDEENRLADVVASSYGLIKLYGTDNHGGVLRNELAGVKFTHPINSVQEFITAVRKGEHVNFIM